ncbi:MAG: hypothetical protein WDZ96_00150 [Acidimicrobiia bacterium]
MEELRKREFADLERAARYVSYEYVQMIRQLDRLATNSLARRFVSDGYIKSSRPEIVPDSDLDAHLRMHLGAFRAVTDFLTKKKPQPDDVVASDYLPRAGDTYVVEPPEWLKVSRDLYNKRAGHLTYGRDQGVAVWYLRHVYWLAEQFGLFLDLLRVVDPERAGWFEEAHDYATQVADGLRASYAESALETPVGVLFFKEWHIHRTLSFDPPRSKGPEHVPPPLFPDLVRWRPQA